MTANKKTIDFGYTKTMLKTDQNNPVVKEYVDAMKRGTNPNPTEKRECKCKDFEYQGLGGRTDNLDCPVHHPVESWEEELNNLIYKYNQGKIAGNPTWSQEAIKKGNAYAFSGITSKMQKKLQDLVRKQIQQAEERGYKQGKIDGIEFCNMKIFAIDTKKFILKEEK